MIPQLEDAIASTCFAATAAAVAVIMSEVARNAAYRLGGAAGAGPARQIDGRRWIETVGVSQHSCDQWRLVQRCLLQVDPPLRRRHRSGLFDQRLEGVGSMECPVRRAGRVGVVAARVAGWDVGHGGVQGHVRRSQWGADRLPN